MQIDNLVPGKYYIRETRTASGYELYEDLIEVDLELNEEMTVTVNNNKEEETEVETTTDNKEVSSTSKRILPVTGM